MSATKKEIKMVDCIFSFAFLLLVGYGNRNSLDLYYRLLKKIKVLVSLKRPNEVKNENFIGFGDSSFCEMHIEFETFREQSNDSKGDVPVSRLDGYLFLLSIDF
jgi:hypothetical protein